MSRFLALCLLLPACAGTAPLAACPVAERGAWTVVAPAEGRPGLITAEVCDEQVTDHLNELACQDRARAFNAELAEVGAAPVYFVMWSEE